MSAQQGSNRPEEKSEGLSKYIKRMRTVLRRNSSTAKTSSATSMQHIASGESSRVAPRSSANLTAEPALAVAQQPQQLVNPPRATTTTTEHPTVVPHWSTVQQEKARSLFAKYGLTLEPHEWKSRSDMTVQRVNKPIRMRVRRTCHRCQTTFGPDKVCVNCQHLRCKKCPRHPTPKSKPKPELGVRMQVPTEKMAKDAMLPPPRRVREPELTIPSRTGGQDLVRRPIRRHVRRTCHECGAFFPTPDTTECVSCRHIRCKKCPRDPPKLHKHPDGYPGDAEPSVEMPQRTWRKPRQRVRYTCHLCSNLYRSGERHCSNCGQERGPSTIRDPPKRNKPEFDPEIVRQVQERLARLDVGV